MNKSIALIFFTLMLFTNCQEKPSDESEAIREHFTSSEISELKKIMQFTDNIVLGKSGQHDLNKAYHQYFEQVDFPNGLGRNEIVVTEEIKYNFLFNLDSSIFNEIWTKGTPRLIRTNDTTLHNPVGFPKLDPTAEND